MSPAIAYDLEPWCELVRSEFVEVPGLRLTPSQAQKLWGLDERTCHRVLRRLMEANYLVPTEDGQFCRADQIDGAASLD